MSCSCSVEHGCGQCRIESVEALLDIFSLLLQEADLALSDACGLFSHALVEFKLLSNRLLILDLCFELLDLEGTLILLLVEVFQSLHGETDLDKLEENLEVAEEVKILSWLVSLSDIFSVLSLSTFSILVDKAGNPFEVVLVKSFWLATSDFLSVIGSGEDFSTVLFEGSSLILENELHQLVKNVEHGFITFVFLEDFLDGFDVLLICILDVLVLLLVHGLDQSLELSDLGSFLGEVRVNLGKLLLELLNSCVTCLELSVSHLCYLNTISESIKLMDTR